jgi:hypothetical protein
VAASRCRPFALERAPGAVLLARHPIEDLGGRHAGRIDALLFKRGLRPSEMSLGYDGNAWRKIL